MAANERERLQVRHTVTGRWLAAGGAWTHRREAGLVIEDRAVAGRLVGLLGCELDAFEVVEMAVPAAA